MKAKIERRELQSLYDLIPKPDIPCVEGCSACCGPVVASRQELERAPALAALINDPEALLGAVLNHSDCVSCPYIDGENHCAVYDGRPFLCRLFGMVEGLPQLTCSYGIRTTKPLNRATAHKLLGRYVKLLHKDKVTHEMVELNSANWAELRAAGFQPWNGGGGG
jgi:hypothetical protein